MTSRGSWIDQDEINNLVGSLGKSEAPDKKKREQAPDPKPAPGEFLSDEISLEPGDAVFELADDDISFDDFPDTPEAEFDIGGGETEIETNIESESDPAVDGIQSPPEDDYEDENQRTFVFEPTDEGKANLVRTLTEARNRANRGGLLKKRFSGKKGSLWPEFPPLEGEKAEENNPSAENVEIELEQAPPEPKKPELPPIDLSLPIRKRLQILADRIIEVYKADVFTITDFSGYSLIRHGAESDAAIAAVSHVTDQLNRLSETVGAPELGSTQISLPNNRWLCLIEAASATGEVLAQLHVPEPFSSTKTAKFRKQLELILAG